MRRHHLVRQIGLLGWKTSQRPTLDASKIAVGTVPVRCRGGVWYPAEATLRRDLDSDPEALVSDWQTITWPFVALTALRSVLRGRVDYTAEAVSATEGCEVEARLVGAAGVYYWHGGAWVVAGSNWNTPAEIEAGLPSWGQRGLGLQVRMRTLDGTTNPIFAGLTLHLEFELSRVSTNVLLPSGWFDDAVFRAVVPLLKDNLAEWADTELITTQQTLVALVPKFTTVDLSTGVGTQKVAVTAIGSVYNLTDDPTRASPLPGTAAGATFVLTTPIAVGKRLGVRYSILPDVVLWSDSDLYTERLPLLGLDGFRVRESVAGVGRSVVIDEATEKAYVIMAPTIDDLACTLSAVAESPGEAADVVEAACEVLSRSGRRVVSTATGIGYDVRESGPLEFGRRGDLHEASVDLIIEGVQRWDAAEYEADYYQEPSVDDVELDAWKRT